MTRSYVPRADLVGMVGKATKRFLKGWFQDLYVSGVLTDGTLSATLADILAALGGAPKNYLDFTGALPGYLRGRLFYDDEDESLAVFIDISGVRHNLGQEHWVRIRNASGAPILNGRVVRITGASMGRLAIAYAQADSAANARIVGVATHDVADQAEGVLTKLGLVHDLDTSAFPAGSPLYLSATSAGAITATPPPRAIFVGYCVVQDATQGIILVDSISALSTRVLTDWADVDPGQGHIPRWNDATKKWTPEAFSPLPGLWTQVAKGSTSVADNSQVVAATISGVANGEILMAIATPRSTLVPLAVYTFDTSTGAGVGQMFYDFSKTLVANEHTFRIKQRSGGAVTVDWVVYKVVPAA